MRTRSLARPGLALLMALLALCSPLDAQRLGSIIGTVRNGEHGPGLEGARVLLIGTELVVITNGKGEFAFHGITPGKYVIQRSEERRVGKEGRSRWSPSGQQKKTAQ